MKLTKAQRREYGLLVKHGSVYVAGQRRRSIFEKLQEKGLAKVDGSFYWFHLK